MEKKAYYSIDPGGKLKCRKCNVPLENGFPVELPLCPVCGFVYVPEELAVGKVLAVEKALEDK